MIVLGAFLLLLDYFLPIPSILITIAWLLIIMGLILLVAEAVGHALGSCRWYY